jgi:hypothetical protein
VNEGVKEWKILMWEGKEEFKKLSRLAIDITVYKAVTYFLEAVSK